MSTSDYRRQRRVLFWGVTIGVGFGAVLDVLVFHLIFQTHHLFSGLYDPYSYDGLRTNVMFDGLFLLVMFGIMSLGLGMLWRIVNGTSERFSTTYLAGSILLGMGVFNVFDGVVSHYVLDLHNVVHDTGAWNPHWLAVSALLLATGWFVLRRADGYRA